MKRVLIRELKWWVHQVEYILKSLSAKNETKTYFVSKRNPYISRRNENRKYWDDQKVNIENHFPFFKCFLYTLVEVFPASNRIDSARKIRHNSLHLASEGDNGEKYKIS